MTDLKKGDRVRVTHVGEVQQITQDGVLYRVGEGRTFTWFEQGHAGGVTIEKLADPEPIWVNGDVIEAGGGVWMRSAGLFRTADKNGWGGHQLITNYWIAGNLKILYKHDAAAVV